MGRVDCIHYHEIYIKKIFVFTSKQVRKCCQMLAFLPVSKARRNKVDICRQCGNIVYVLYFHIKEPNIL